MTIEKRVINAIKQAVNETGIDLINTRKPCGRFKAGVYDFQSLIEKISGVSVCVIPCAFEGYTCTIYDKRGKFYGTIRITNNEIRRIT